MIKRPGAIIICLLFILITLGGCSRNPAQGEPRGEAPAVISVWYTLDGGVEQELLRQFEVLNQKQAGVIVKGEQIPESGFVDYVWKMQAGGEGPDILIAKRQDIHALYEKGALAPVLAQDYSTYESAEMAFSFNKQVYAVPWLIDVPLLYYRSDRVEEPPADLNVLWLKKAAVVIPSLDFALLSPWWKAEGGTLSLSGVPRLNSSANLTFLNKLLYLKTEGLLVFDNSPLKRLAGEQVNYALAWASQSNILEKAQVQWECISLNSLLGNKAGIQLENVIGIANSSIKTIPSRENAIRLVQEQLVRTETETALFQSGYLLPASTEYYEQQDSRTDLKNETAKAIRNAWSLSGNSRDWKFAAFLDTSWRNIAGGADPEKELAAAQQKALDLE